VLKFQGRPRHLTRADLFNLKMDSRHFADLISLAHAARKVLNIAMTRQLMPIEPIESSRPVSTQYTVLNDQISKSVVAQAEIFPRRAPPSMVSNEHLNTQPLDAYPLNTQPLNINVLKETIPEQQKPFQTEPESLSSQTRRQRRPLEESRVPTTRIGRLWHYGSLAAGLGVGAMSEGLKRVATGAASIEGSSIMVNPGNIERMVNRLSKMRGAALKLGQMLSIQDNAFLPPPLEDLLLRVQNGANYMPEGQLQQVMVAELGQDWLKLFRDFDMIPIAAASMGQVHKATLHDGREVAVKVQYPGVAESIDSDLDNLKTLLVFSNLLPRGLFLENTINAARIELGREADYIAEAESMERVAGLIGRNESFEVPSVVHKLSTRRVLTSEFVPGIPINEAAGETQEVRDRIGQRMLSLCLTELFEWKFMQTDPNWTNFYYDKASDKIFLIDFGSARAFDQFFTDKYINVLRAAAKGDRDGIVKWSIDLGYLTGQENEPMRDAHVEAVLTLAKPFSQQGPDVYDFGAQDVTDKVKSLIPVMLRYRLTPPPEETYSLHRKLSGAFLLASKLGSRIRCKELFEEYSRQYTPLV
jgi:aarF domain-containing kinase